MKTIIIGALLLLCPLFALSQDFSKEARDAVSKALKEKRIEASELGSYYSLINNGKSADVIKKLETPGDKGVFGSANFAPSAEKPVGWRGDWSGRFPGATPPLKWGRKLDGSIDNIAWIAETPSFSGSSPVIAGNKIFITSASCDLVCFDKKTGKLLWVKSAGFYDAATPEDRAKFTEVFKSLDMLAKLREKMNNELPSLTEPGEVWKEGQDKSKNILDKMDSLLAAADPERFKIFERIDATTTPCTDGQFVYVLHNTTGILACYDFDGNRKWLSFICEPAVKFQHHGYTSSPLLIDGKVIVFFKGYRAFDAATGKQLWSKNGSEPQGLRYGTPAAVPGRKDIFVGCTGAVFKTSDCSLYSKQNITVSESWGGGVFSDGYVAFLHARGYTENGFKPLGWYKLPSAPSASSITAVCPDKPGQDMLKPEWSGNGQPIYNTFATTPLIYGGLIYIGSEGGGYSGRGTETPFIFAYGLEKGELVYSLPADFFVQRYYSPYSVYSLQTPFSMAGGNIFVLGPLNEIVILAPGKEMKELERNKIEMKSLSIGDKYKEWCVAPPVFEGNKIYLRSESHVYCIGKD